MTRRRRNVLLLAAVTALLVMWGAAVGMLGSTRDEGTPAADTGAGTSNGFAIVEQERSAFRAGPLPEGVDRARAPRFVLDDARGGRLDTASLKGRPYLVTFLYTDCQDVCPLIAQEVRQALERLGPRGREVTAVAVTADPQADTPDAVRGWLDEQGMPDNFRYLLGTRRELAPVWKAHYAAPQPHDKAASAHSASIWLVDRKGRWRAKFSGGAPVPPGDIAHDLRLLLDEPA